MAGSQLIFAIPPFSRDMSKSLVWRNGCWATEKDLSEAISGFGHFTTMQVRANAVRGLDLHLVRLATATRELFGITGDEVCWQQWMRSALSAAAVSDCTMRVIISVPTADRAANPMDAGVIPHVFIAVADPASFDRGRLRVSSMHFERAMPHLKHTGVFASRHHRQQAIASGFDDVLFVDGEDRILEGSFWNLGLWRNGRVTWPEALALRGTCESMLRRGLAELEVEQEDLPVALADLHTFEAAFIANSRGFSLLSAIDGRIFEGATKLRDSLSRALETQPWQPL